MLKILDYSISEQIYESNNSLVYRGYHQDTNDLVILKMLKQAYPSPEKIAWFQREYAITQSLDTSACVNAYSLESFQNRWVMILEDFGGSSLLEITNNHAFELEDFWPLAISIVEAIGQVHSQGLIHKDINPSNIVLNRETGQLKLIDFGISTQLSLENPTSDNPNCLEGTLAYISPEQTGRMNRAIDYRTDFYSLGISFYYLLIGHLPFSAIDAVELVHAHMARQPSSLHHLRPEIPQPLSEIVMKLMAKNAEDRYQTTDGIKVDLEECQKQWKQNRGKIYSFPLGQNDTAARFQIPQKLYGRKSEIKRLLAGFERVEYGASEIMLVAGYSGIGKTSLVREIYKPIAQTGGYFISGKFDQYQQDLPYASLIQAFHSLVRRLLTESDQQVDNWREKIQAALGENAQIIIEVIPEVELIIGSQPAVPELTPTESQNRFNQVFRNFIGVFTKPEHPLILFLDDLQWVDGASLQLIQQVMSSKDCRYLYIIGAYRDNEVETTHPLMLMLDSLQEVTGRGVETIYLKSLNSNFIQQLLAETCYRSQGSVKALANLIETKTQGNPFFINQFLRSLYTEKLVYFNNKKKYWDWNLLRIKTRDITDNVVELMAAKLRKLGLETQLILQKAACIGSQFDLQTLAAVSEKEPHTTAQILWSAIKEELILPIDDAYRLADISVKGLEKSIKVGYKFAHDRVQQSAYLLIPESEKAVVHFDIGHLLLAHTPLQEREQKIFDIVNQLNLAKTLLARREEREELAQLNLQAGRKAKASTAFISAYQYFKLGLDLLGEQSWIQNYDLTLALYQEAAESGYLSDHFDDAEQLAITGISKVRATLDAVAIYEVRIRAFNSKNELLKAIEIGREVLKLLDISFPESPGPADIKEALQEVKLAWSSSSPSDLANLPLMDNPEKLATIKLIKTLSVPVYNAQPQLYCLLVSKMVCLSIRYGNTIDSTYAYASYAMVLCGIALDLEIGYQFGQLALELVEKLNAKKIKSSVLFLIHCFTIHWKKHLRYTLNPSLEAFQIGRETGDLQFSAFGLYTYCFYSFWSGKELEPLEKDIEKYSLIMEEMNQKNILSYQGQYWQIILNLLNRAENPCHLVGKGYDEVEMLPIINKVGDAYALSDFYIKKAMLCFLFRKPSRAVEYIETAEEYLSGNLSTFVVPVFYFYDSLIRLAVYSNTPPKLQNSLQEKVLANQEKLKFYADYAPMNFLHKFYLVEAEYTRVLGLDDIKSREFYDKSISLASENGYLNEEALAYELAGNFYLARELNHVARHYLYDAHYTYRKWGAQAKVKDLEAQYPQFLASKLLGASLKADKISSSVPSTTAKGSGEELDLATVIKASQAISGEVVLEKLIKNLMRAVIENAGAQESFLILNRGDCLVIEAESSIDSDDVAILKSTPIDFVDKDRNFPILPTSIINYVFRTQENLVLDDATREDKFSKDPYILATQPKSILCTPLINQGNLSGILYLENNLAEGAFTSDRIEILSILSSQAAISIDNSRLYQTLEQKVEERTQELSQTLDVLKATQAELIFENDLLRSADQPSNFTYQVGGSLPMDSPTYVVRSADRNLYKVLKQGEFCHILNARQMGKSSLMVRMIHHLKNEGYDCIAIDMTLLGSENVTPEQWYKGFVVELWRCFGLTSKVSLKTWWNEKKDISPVQRLSHFIEEFLLVDPASDAPPRKRVVMLDEIDNLLGLSFPISDFFALIRACYNRRALNPDYNNLTFALIGVVTPSDLIRDRRRTPFNISQPINLEGFKEHEAQPLLSGLAEKVSNPQVLLKEVLAWTGGQPFLTQKLCRLIRLTDETIPHNQEAEWTENLVHKQIIEHWESQDEPEHLRTIRDRILNSENSAKELLLLYRKVLSQTEDQPTLAVDSPEEKELLLSGIIVKHLGALKVYNRIYQLVFDLPWITTHLEKLSE